MSRTVTGDTLCKTSAQSRPIREVIQFLALLFVLNALVFSSAFFATLNSSATLVFNDVLIGDWKIAQYLSAYQLEFMKRGLVATGFAVFNIEVSYQSIAIFTSCVINLFFLLFYFYTRRLFNGAQAYFPVFMLLFIVAPGTAMQMGDDFARFDQINMLLTLLALMVMLAAEEDRGPLALLKVVAVSAVLVVGLLIHEAFLFINAPLLLAVCYQRVRAGRIPRYALPCHGVSIFVTMVVLIKFGFATPEVIQAMAVAIKQIAPDYDSALSLRVWDRKLVKSLTYTISLYFKWHYLKQLLVLSLPVLVYSYGVYRLCFTKSLSRDYWPVLLSPFAIAPMYILGCDFPRWTGVLVFLLFMVMVVMVHDKKVCWPDQKYLSARYILPFVGVCLLAGPVGVTEAFPERWAVLSYAKSLVAMFAG
jgi:hypothetical protein